MQSVNATSAPICRSVCRNQCRAFFYQPSILLHRVVNKCKLRVHCHDVCNIAPSTCISVNCVEIPLDVIRSNVHKTVVSYKTVQSFCSDVVVQNVNVISSAACEVVCFRKHYVSPIKCLMLVRSPFTVTSSRPLPSFITAIAFIIIIIIIITITFIVNFNITIIIIFIINIAIIIK